MRKTLAITLAACLLLCGCGGNGVKREENAPKPNTNQRFLCEDGEYRFETVVDSQTGVTYIIWKDGYSSSAKGGITVLLDKDGKPIISEEVSQDVQTPTSCWH